MNLNENLMEPSNLVSFSSRHSNVLLTESSDAVHFAEYQEFSNIQVFQVFKRHALSFTYNNGKFSILIFFLRFYCKLVGHSWELHNY